MERNAQRTLLIMAGGTGGHVMPALAVAEVLRTRGWRIVWLGAPNGMEATLAAKNGYALEPVAFTGLRGKGLLAKLLLPTRLLIAFWQSLRAIRRVAPEAVLGMGGYISFPGGMMAALLNRPLVIHEQNAIAGLANRVLAQVADRVLVAFPGAIGKAVVVGNPVRSAITSVETPEARYAARSGPLRLLVVGGSLGAQSLNTTIPQALALMDPGTRPLVTHQAGAKNIDALNASYRQAGVTGELVAFIDDMASAYAKADLIVCRAGAMTVAEVAAVGVAALFVPFPLAVDDHQTANARYLVDAGAAIMIQQRELTPAHLAAAIGALNRDRLVVMAARARTLARPDASRDVADICESLV
ncbi:MAG: undecaprenyldiphospho-muramoylpentapeptide beta-N-acetylglucosaminyltransferase [Betaproteobacteria bacterium]|nr:undecaprenyldiphospho-muramoylpentapeptide beta-N-acetylglucosaminyltransferase [Betaproteobacteria bacterium]